MIMRPIFILSVLKSKNKQKSVFSANFNKLKFAPVVVIVAFTSVFIFVSGEKQLLLTK